MRAAWVVGLVLLAGCGEKTKEHVGVGRWNVTTAKLKDTVEPKREGRCMPSDISGGRKGSYCMGLNPIGIRGMTGNIDLYFAGTEPTSPLSELQLKVGACQEEQLSAWLQTNFGAPGSRQANRAIWENPNLLIAGFLPLVDEPGTCLVRMYPKSEQAAFDAVIKP